MGNKITDVVMLSYTANEDLFKMTQNAVDSLLDSERGHTFRITIIETNKNFYDSYKYSGANVIIPSGKFNYNRFVNIGLENCKSEYIVVSNNDVIFYKGWFSKILQCMKAEKLDSASPYCPYTASVYGLVNFKGNANIGYETGKHLFGYCIVANKKVYDTIGKLDESFEFYCQDIDYLRQLKEHGFRQGVVKSSKVKHIFSASHNLFGSEEEKQRMTTGMYGVLNNKYQLKNKTTNEQS